MTKNSYGVVSFALTTPYLLHAFTRRALDEEISAHIIALERGALDRWGKGDPSGYLEISDADVTYFDPFLEKRLDGLNALTAYYDNIRGKIYIDHDQIINPNVAVSGDIAVLTFNYVSHSGDMQMKWNCTEVYRQKTKQWKIIQTHWSITQHLN